MRLYRDEAGRSSSFLMPISSVVVAVEKVMALAEKEKRCNYLYSSALPFLVVAFLDVVASNEWWDEGVHSSCWYWSVPMSIWAHRKQLMERNHSEWMDMMMVDATLPNSYLSRSVGVDVAVNACSVDFVSTVKFDVPRYVLSCAVAVLDARIASLRPRPNDTNSLVPRWPDW